MVDSCIRLLPDYALNPTTRKLGLEKVGIKNFKQFRYDFADQRVLTHQSAYVDLTNGDAGIHMSRLSGLLRERKDTAITIDSGLLEAMAKSHKTHSAYHEINWETEYLMENEQELFVPCMLEGVQHGGNQDWFLTMVVPYASVCPCAATMCDDAEDKDDIAGHPHMQRAEARITGSLDEDDDLNELMLAMMARVVEAVDLVPIPFMKRPQELDWCQRAAETNLFVEDAARIIGSIADKWMDDWVVVCTHFESIHQHDVVAVCRKGKKLV